MGGGAVGRALKYAAMSIFVLMVPAANRGLEEKQSAGVDGRRASQQP